MLQSEQWQVGQKPLSNNEVQSRPEPVNLELMNDMENFAPINEMKIDDLNNEVCNKSTSHVNMARKGLSVHYDTAWK